MIYDVTVFADLCIDMLFSGNVTPQFNQVEQFVDDYQIELGGSAAIFASQFKKLGGEPCLLGVVGNDTLGDILVGKIKELGISPEEIYQSPVLKTGVGLGLIKGQDRAMLTYTGSISGVTESIVEESGILQTTKHLHIASYFLLEQLHNFWKKELPRLKTEGVSISLDTNWAPLGNWEKVLDILQYVDVFIPNEQEALLISGKETVREAGEFLTRYAKTVVIKQGPTGASVFSEEITGHYPIPQGLVDDLVMADTTGAGDNFDAGFLRAWLAGSSLDFCVELGTKCAIHSLSKMGGTAGQFVDYK